MQTATSNEELDANMALTSSTEANGQGKTLQYTRRGLKMVGERSFFDLDEPVWHADEKSPSCDKCHSHFTLVLRRHHCRRCGEVICSKCSEKMPLVRMGYVDPVIVCKGCAVPCHSEDEFFKTQLKLLSNGAYFHRSDSDDPNSECELKLSSDRNVIISSIHHLPIALKDILEIKTIHDDSHHSKNMSLELVYRSRGEEKTLTISPSPSHSWKQSVDWLKALKKGLIMTHKHI